MICPALTAPELTSIAPTPSLRQRHGLAPRSPPPLVREEPLVPPRRPPGAGRASLQELPRAQVDRAAAALRGASKNRRVAGDKPLLFYYIASNTIDSINVYRYLK